MTQEIILQKVRQRLGPLNSQAEQAVKEALEILQMPKETKLPETPEERFVGANVNVAQYKAWSRDVRLKYQTEPEKVNKHWIEKKLQELRAAWMMVVDGQVVAHGSLTDYPFDDEFGALCERFGKFPFVFLSPSVLMIEEKLPWYDTVEYGDAYPTVPVTIQGASNHLEVKADFDTGALGLYLDQ
jgi:hypothetical protein